ncbi:methyl-accepting chemotaxis protein [Oceanimonas sp. GK1]|uniref:methyl-accepting chemotaxis protein n=1 Tax=Oceanimonas sp. (strain GK1 / IBRC-M 10197) TaxID=511062 RepID=UPI00024951A0|nr:methyl-accepting chemotaxis protein [Oceanimonas sp. GK1]AEY01844.1 methyl-accepting chemotaxis protein [Oceanimonas sp. GK1]
MNIGLRSGLAFGVIGVLMLILGGLSLVQLTSLNDQITVLATQRVPSLTAVENIDKEFLRIRLHSLALANSAEADKRAESRANLEAARQKLDGFKQQYDSLARMPEARALLSRFTATEARYWQAHGRIMRQAEAGDVAGANLASRQELAPLAEELAGLLHQLNALQHQRIDDTNSETDSVYASSRNIIIAILTLALVGMAALAWLLTRSIVQPIGDAVRVAERIAGGDLTHPVQISGKDEPGRLLQALGHMQHSLKDTVRLITDSSHRLASTSEELSSVTEESTRGLHRQSQELEQAATAVNEMTAAVEEVARNASSTSQESELADERAQFGRDRVGQTVMAMEGLAGEIGDTMHNIERLAGRVNDITSVLDVIRAIADQTNLLALNAAIEAARAGESGRGFAVVADEVRALAHRTQESTKEIEQMIQAVQRGSQEAVTAMKTSNERTAGTLNIAREAGEALAQIATSISGINDRNVAIAGAAEEQAHVAREVDGNLVNIRDLSVQSAAGANQTSASSQELARLAGELHTLVNRFVI